MIYYMTLQDNAAPIRRLLPDLHDVRLFTYEELFFRRKGPLGHYVFADVDRLTHFEQEIVVRWADALKKAREEIRILNDPRWVLERYPLLKSLERRGINSFSVTRLDDGSRPKRYPVFIRSEDGHWGPDTDLLFSEQELEQALKELQKQGKVLKRRIAVEYCAQPDAEGYFRKYGCINIGGRVVPQHVFESREWMVKSTSKSREAALGAAEMAFIRENPHEEKLREIFQIAHIDFGRADYTIVNSEIQVYEINTNPNLPRLTDRPGKARKAERRRFFNQWVNDAFAALNTPIRPGPAVSFELPAPLFHRMRQWTPEDQALPFQMWTRFVKSHPKWARRIPGRASIRAFIRMFYQR